MGVPGAGWWHVILARIGGTMSCSSNSVVAFGFGVVAWIWIMYFGALRMR